MDCAGVDRTLDESNGVSTDYVPDAFPFPLVCFLVTVVEEAFVDVVVLEVKLLVVSDVVEVMHPMILAVVHKFCSTDLLLVMLTIPVVASCEVIVDALKLVDHVQQQQLQL